MAHSFPRNLRHQSIPAAGLHPLPADEWVSGQARRSPIADKAWHDARRTA